MAQGSLGTALDYVQDKSFFEKRNEILHQFLGVTSFSEVLFFSSLYKDRKEEADELFDLAEELVRIALFTHYRIYPKETMDEYPMLWKKGIDNPNAQRSLLKILDGLAIARAKKASQVSWQGLLEEILIDIMEENHKWQQ